jgi:hypothetical protein
MNRTTPAGQGHAPALPCPLPKVVLEIVRGRARQMSRLVGRRAFLIGAAAECDLVLADDRFADVYALLLVRAAGVTIRGLGPGPRLAVAGCDVSWAELADGDRLEMGPYAFDVRIAWPTGAAPPVVGRRTTQGHPRAVARLLHDVETWAPAARLALYVGDEPQTSKPAGRSWSPRAWFQRKA